MSEVSVLDRMGRLVGHVDADNDLTEYRWDGSGREITSIDPEGNERLSLYDANDNLLSLTEIEHSALLSGAETFVTTNGKASVVCARIRPSWFPTSRTWA